MIIEVKREQLCCREISTFLSLGCKYKVNRSATLFMENWTLPWLRKNKINSLYKGEKIHFFAHTAVTEWDRPAHPSSWLSLLSKAEEGVGPNDGHRSEQVGHTSWSGLLLPFAVSRVTGLCFISARTLSCISMYCMCAVKLKRIPKPLCEMKVPLASASTHPNENAESLKHRIKTLMFQPLLLYHALF